MLQTIAVIAIITAAAAMVAVWVYRFLAGPGASGCDPSRCAHCPYAGQAGECRPGSEKNSKNK